MQPCVKCNDCSVCCFDTCLDQDRACCVDTIFTSVTKSFEASFQLLLIAFLASFISIKTPSAMIKIELDESIQLICKIYFHFLVDQFNKFVFFSLSLSWQVEVFQKVISILKLLNFPIKSYYIKMYDKNENILKLFFSFWNNIKVRRNINNLVQESNSPLQLLEINKTSYVSLFKLYSQLSYIQINMASFG